MRDFHNYEINDDITALLQRLPQRLPAQLNINCTDVPVEASSTTTQLSLTKKTRTSTNLEVRLRNFYNYEINDNMKC